LSLIPVGLSNNLKFSNVLVIKRLIASKRINCPSVTLRQKFFPALALNFSRFFLWLGVLNITKAETS